MEGKIMTNTHFATVTLATAFCVLTQANSRPAHADEPAPLPPGVTPEQVAEIEAAESATAAEAVQTLLERTDQNEPLAAGVALTFPGPQPGYGPSDEFSGVIMVNGVEVSTTDSDQFQAAQKLLHHAVAARIATATATLQESGAEQGLSAAVVIGEESFQTTRTAEFLRLQRQLHRSLQHSLVNFDLELGVFMGVIVGSDSVHLFDNHAAFAAAQSASSK